MLSLHHIGYWGFLADCWSFLRCVLNFKEDMFSVFISSSIFPIYTLFFLPEFVNAMLGCSNTSMNEPSFSSMKHCAFRPRLFETLSSIGIYQSVKHFKYFSLDYLVILFGSINTSLKWLFWAEKKRLWDGCNAVLLRSWEEEGDDSKGIVPFDSLYFSAFLYFLYSRALF